MESSGEKTPESLDEKSQADRQKYRGIKRVENLEKDMRSLREERLRLEQEASVKEHERKEEVVSSRPGEPLLPQSKPSRGQAFTGKLKSPETRKSQH